MLSGEGKEQKEKGRGEGRGLAVSIGRGPSGAAVARPPNFPYARNGTNTRSSIFRSRLCCPTLGLKSIPDDFFPFFRIVSPLCGGTVRVVCIRQKCRYLSRSLMLRCPSSSFFSFFLSLFVDALVFLLYSLLLKNRRGNRERDSLSQKRMEQWMEQQQQQQQQQQHNGNRHATTTNSLLSPGAPSWSDTFWSVGAVFWGRGEKKGQAFDPRRITR